MLGQGGVSGLLRNRTTHRMNATAPRALRARSTDRESNTRPIRRVAHLVRVLPTTGSERHLLAESVECLDSDGLTFVSGASRVRTGASELPLPAAWCRKREAVNSQAASALCS